MIAKILCSGGVGDIVGYVMREEHNKEKYTADTWWLIVWPTINARKGHLSHVKHSRHETDIIKSLIRRHEQRSQADTTFSYYYPTTP